MRKLFAAVAVVIALGTGCTVQVGPESTPSQSAPETTQAPSTGATLSDSEYVDFMRESDPWLADLPGDVIVDNAVLVCQSLDTGSTVEDILLIMTDSGIPPFTQGTLLGGAIGWKCPEYASLLDEGMGI